jgi:metal-responsive CopG/Arc/MetJ family transcriptional regulator
MTGNTRNMKTAISLPDDLFEEIEVCAREMKMSRSRVLAVAARDFLARRRSPNAATKSWNRVIERVGQPGDDRAAKAFQRLGKAVIRARGR